MLVLIVLCAACGTLGYFYGPDDYTEVTIAGTNVAEVVGWTTSTPSASEATVIAMLTTTPTFVPVATRTPTITPTPRTSPTLPPTDTPIPRPTPTVTNTPGPPTPTLDPNVDLAATEVAEAIVSIILTPDDLAGTINLVKPENNTVFAPGVGQTEFSWTWTGGAGCDPLPDGYGFDLRIWPNRADFGPLGVDDINKIQEEIVCIPESGKRVYRLYYLSGVPAVQLQGAGSFLWDVAFVKISPHTPIYASQPRALEISLNYPRPGPLDPDGAIGSVTCANFSAWAEAQAFYIAAGGPGEDKFNLDPERNGVACNAIAPCLLVEELASCQSKFQ